MPLTVRLTMDEKAACVKAARRANIPVSKWIRDTLLAACKKP